MEFALNYSEPAARLVGEGAIEIDRFKCPDWPDTIAAAQQLRPAYAHFPIEVGTAKFADTHFDRIAALAKATATRFINVHLVPNAWDFPDEADAEARLIDDITQVVQRFGKDRVIIEMAPWGNPAENFVRGATETDMITRLIAKTGAGLLLDLSHARITAQVTKQDERDFLDRMPVAHLRELHVTGLGYIGPILKDHLPMTDDDWRMLEWTLDRIASKKWPTPWCLACEYGGIGEAFAKMTDPSVLARDVPRMWEMVNAMRRFG